MTEKAQSGTENISVALRDYSVGLRVIKNITQRKSQRRHRVAQRKKSSPSEKDNKNCIKIVHSVLKLNTILHD
ncbi:MAG: hypothetical protein M9898_07740 [Chitinophagaceae bacterium]|nr:hypothetical protein [Chitinophagaceae bacterium]